MTNEYWDNFVPSMPATELGNAKDSDPQLADAWLGWQQARAVDAQTIREARELLEHAPSWHKPRSTCSWCERRREFLKRTAEGGDEHGT